MGIFNSPIFNNVGLLGNALIQQEQFQVRQMTQGMQQDMEYILGKKSVYPVKFGAKNTKRSSFHHAFKPRVTSADNVTWVGAPGSAEIKIYAERNVMMRETTITHVKIGDQRFFPEKPMKKEAPQSTPLQWLDSRVCTLPREKVST